MYKVVYSDSLQHHGILGQKWGVRRYQNADGSLTAVGRRRYASAERSERKAENAKTSLGKQYHTYNAATKRAEIDRANRVKSAKGLGNKYSEAFGYKNQEATKKYESEWRGKNSEIAKTSIGKKYNAMKSFNANSKSEYASYMKNRTVGEKFIESKTKANWLSTPIQTLSGRKSTVIKEKTLSSVHKALLNIGQLKAESKVKSLDKKIDKLEKKKDFDVKSFDAITEDLKYKSGKVFYSVEDAKRDQKIISDRYDKTIESTKEKRDKYYDRANR